MGFVDNVNQVARLYYDVSARCGVEKELPYSEGARLFRKLSAISKKNSDLDLAWYLEAQFFLRPGRHLNVASVGDGQGERAYYLYSYLSMQHDRQTILCRLRRDASFLNVGIRMRGMPLRDLMLFVDPEPSDGIPEGVSWVLNKCISPAFLSISRSYGDLYRNMGEFGKFMPNPEGLSTIRWFIMVTQDLRKYCKDRFGDECNF